MVTWVNILDLSVVLFSFSLGLYTATYCTAEIKYLTEIVFELFRRKKNYCASIKWPDKKLLNKRCVCEITCFSALRT